jgi:hypothetical protein
MTHTDVIARSAICTPDDRERTDGKKLILSEYRPVTRNQIAAHLQEQLHRTMRKGPLPTH